MLCIRYKEILFFFPSCFLSVAYKPPPNLFQLSRCCATWFKPSILFKSSDHLIWSLPTPRPFLHGFHYCLPHHFSCSLTTCPAQLHFRLTALLITSTTFVLSLIKLLVLWSPGIFAVLFFL